MCLSPYKHRFSDDGLFDIQRSHRTALAEFQLAFVRSLVATPEYVAEMDVSQRTAGRGILQTDGIAVGNLDVGEGDARNRT